MQYMKVVLENVPGHVYPFPPFSCHINTIIRLFKYTLGLASNLRRIGGQPTFLTPQLHSCFTISLKWNFTNIFWNNFIILISYLLSLIYYQLFIPLKICVKSHQHFRRVSMWEISTLYPHKNKLTWLDDEGGERWRWGCAREPEEQQWDDKPYWFCDKYRKSLLHHSTPNRLPGSSLCLASQSGPGSAQDWLTGKHQISS